MNKPTNLCAQALALVQSAQALPGSDATDLALQYVADILDTLADPFRDLGGPLMDAAVAHDLAKWSDRQETLI